MFTSYVTKSPSIEATKQVSNIIITCICTLDMLSKTLNSQQLVLLDKFIKDIFPCLKEKADLGRYKIPQSVQDLAKRTVTSKLKDRPRFTPVKKITKVKPPDEQEGDAEGGQDSTANSPQPDSSKNQIILQHQIIIL